jgi:L-lactate dehydrogenase complex protein LldE
MIPCYIDMFYPQVGVATLELLEKLGVEVELPPVPDFRHPG